MPVKCCSGGARAEPEAGRALELGFSWSGWRLTAVAVMAGTVTWVVMDVTVSGVGG